MSNDNFLHPLLYHGPKAEKAVSVPGALVPVVFKKGPLSEPGQALAGQRYADVTEKQGRHLVRLHRDIFKWPEGTQFGPQAVSVEQFEALVERVAVLEAQLAAPVEPSPKRARSAKDAEAAHAVEAV